jgi:hypothetical protein
MVKSSSSFITLYVLLLLLMAMFFMCRIMENCNLFDQLPADVLGYPNLEVL